MQKAVQNKTALYCRLSVDDNCDGESDSIQNQRLILQKYAKDHGFLDTVVFADDGVSGTTFECTAHYIREDGLKELVVDNLRQVTHFAGEYEEQFLAQVTNCGEQERRRALKALENDLQSGQRRLKEIHRIVKRLYEDNVNGKLTDEQFRSFSQDYETERGGLEVRVEFLTLAKSNKTA